MTRPLTLLGAPSNIGIRPYDDGTPRSLDRAPAVLRDLGLERRLGAESGGDVVPRPYRDFARPPGRPRNEAAIAALSGELADRVAGITARGRIPLVLGGDCSIVLGCLLGLRQGGAKRVGLAYLDGHADFATPLESVTGSAASMCLAMAVGRGDTPLARLGGGGPLVRATDAALAGRRDRAEPWYGHDALAASPILDLPGREVDAAGWGPTGATVLDRVARDDLDGFWIHLDADLLDPAVMPAVDSPLPGGPDVAALAELLGPLVRHPKALGMELTIYDPTLDPGLAAGERLVDLLERVFRG